jgi:DNA-binding NarL/FixJ family response regulator
MTKMLTTKESDVLNLMLKGLSTKQIAHKLNIPEGTVKGRKQCVMLHYGVSTSSQLFARILTHFDVGIALMKIENEIDQKYRRRNEDL